MRCVGRPNRTPYSLWVATYPIIDLNVEQEETGDLVVHMARDLGDILQLIGFGFAEPATATSRVLRASLCCSTRNSTVSER